jgi:hypothetical protein
MPDSQSLQQHAAKLSKAAAEVAARTKELAALADALEANAFLAPSVAAALGRALDATRESLGALDGARAWATSVSADAERHQVRQKARLAGAISTALEAQGHTVSGQVPELIVGPLMLEFVYETGKARIWYGPRAVELTRVELTAEAVAPAVGQALRELDTQPFDSHRFLAEVFAAFRVAATRHHTNPDSFSAPWGAVWSELVWIRQGEAFWGKPSKAGFVEYSAVQFSYDLFRCAERVVDGHELRLNIATREQTRKSADSIWVPRNRRGEGTHFASLSFRRAEAAS